LAKGHCATKNRNIFAKVCLDPAKIVETSLKGGNDDRIELPTRFSLDNLARLLRWIGPLVGPLGGQSVINVGQGDDAGRKWNPISTQSGGVACAIEPLVLEPCDQGGHGQESATA